MNTRRVAHPVVLWHKLRPLRTSPNEPHPHNIKLGDEHRIIGELSKFTMASGSSKKKGPIHDYIQRSSSSEKESHCRVQSGPLRHSSTAKTSRYSPVTGRKETKPSVGESVCSATTPFSQKGM